MSYVYKKCVFVLQYDTMIMITCIQYRLIQ